MLARPRSLLTLAALATSALAARPAAASQSLDCKRGHPGQLSCWDGKLTLRAADVRNEKLAASSPDDGDIFVSHDHACALTPDGDLRCWGDNDNGQLGDGTRAHRARRGSVRVRGLDGVTAVALGHGQSCALLRSGEVACWGYDDVTRSVRLKPSVVPSLDHVVEIVAGSDYACARRRNGSVWCWGNNHYGQLGDGTQKSRSRPVRVVGLSGAVELSAGNSHACARRQDGSVWCWGNGWGGEDGTDDRLLVPARVPAIRGATALVSSTNGLLALQKDGRVVSCRYHVGQTESESSPRLICRHVRKVRARDLDGAQIAIRR